MKKGIYLLNKDTIEEEFSNFNYAPEDYWEEIQFDEVPLHVTRNKIKRKGIFMYRYEIKTPFLLGYVDGWKIYIDTNDASDFEKAFRVGENEIEWVDKLISILAAKQI
jgi:hypothetical protein